MKKDVDDTQQDLQSLLMTKKEIKALHKYEREEKKKKALKDKYPDIPYNTPEPTEYVKIKKKLDSIEPIDDDIKVSKIDNKRDVDDNVYDDSDDSVDLDEKHENNIQNVEHDDNDDNSDIIDSVKNQIATANKQITQEKQIITQSQQQIQQTPQNSIQSFGNMPDLVKPRQTQDAGRVIQNQVMNPPMDDTGDIDLNKLFSSEMGNESDVVKELFSQDNIKVKTELTQDEISIISRLELQASMTQNFFLAKILKELETLRVSKDRKSRQEFVNSFSGIRQDQSGATAFGKLGNIFKNDKV